MEAKKKARKQTFSFNVRLEVKATSEREARQVVQTLAQQGVVPTRRGAKDHIGMVAVVRFAHMLVARRNGKGRIIAREWVDVKLPEQA